MSLRCFDNREMRVFHSQLADAMRGLYGQRCPCCDSTMVNPRRKTEANNRRRDKITVAHDVPVGMGGDPTVWVYACLGCNTDQGARPFDAWGLQLQRAGDRRAAAVLLLSHRIATFLETKRHGQPAEMAATADRDTAVAG